jgi:hypothetical protein
MRLLLLVALLAAPTAFAQTQAWNTNVLTWSAHTTCSDGTAATNCPAAQWRIERAASPTATTWDFVAIVPASPLRYEHLNAAAGQNCYRVKGVSATGGTGVASQVLANSCKTNIAPPPPVPGQPGAAVVADVTAYEVRPNSKGTMVASRIGIVPTGTVCTQETRVANSVTYNRIDPKAVDLINWPNRLPPTEVFARCATG